MRHLLKDGSTVARFMVIVGALTLVTSPLLVSQQATAQEAEWIWSPDHDKNDVPSGDCYFRKSFNINSPERGEIRIAADDAYELYFNGKRIGTGSSARNLDRYDLRSHLRRGRNIVAVKVSNQRGSTAALAARVQVKERGRGWSNFSTDESWRTAISTFPLWSLPVYNDRGWQRAQSFGPLGSTEPWDRRKEVAVTQQQSHERFRISSEFRVQRVLGDDDIKSVIAMTFNEFGQILASQEDGPLMLITDANRDGAPDKVQTYCEEVKSCQGILALNGDVYVTAGGPEGNALYKLTDKDRDGKAELVEALVKFKGPPGEHGPHGLTLGPDGKIYVVIGNHSGVDGEFAESSPHKNYYSGDLVPRYEDPGGHAVGVKVPGGTVVRTDLKGEKVELVAGGLRNAYDLAFNEHGDLFVHDSDMESDIGTSWYRPTQVYEVIPGGDYGWRSGWSKWSDYFVDTLPAIVDSGRGSPTGAVTYNHVMFPKRFHGALFLGDWSEGRIIVVMMKRSGGKYLYNSEVFVEGQPLNVTDLEVGPNGSLYFTTGGRGTGGGIFKISWTGKVPPGIRNFGEGITRVIRQPQFNSAWARQEIARSKLKIGDDWQRLVSGVALTAANPPQYRTRALDVMQLYGPLPTSELLVTLSTDQNEEVRAKATELMGLNADDATREALIDLLQDPDRIVRRKSCEALVRAEQTAPATRLLSLLTSESRFESYAARRLLERVPSESWRNMILTTGDHRLFIQGALALMIAEPTKENAIAVISRMSTLLEGFVSDHNFIDLLRVAHVTIQRGKLKPDDTPVFRLQVAEEFPSGNSRMNRQLAPLLAFFKVGEITDRYLAFVQSQDVPDVDKLHVAVYLRFVADGWTTDQRLEMLRFYSKAIEWEGGGSYEHYVMNASRDFAKSIDPEDAMLVIEDGARWPHAAVGALYKLPKLVDEKTLATVKRLEDELEGREDDAARQFKIGLVAILARSGDDASLEHLRDVWLRDPERREIIAMGLAQSPGGENWDYLLHSLAIVDKEAAREVMKKLVTVNFRPDEAEFYRHVIMKGLALEDKGADLSIELLKHWTGEDVSAEDAEWKTAIADWQKWYRQKFPNGADPVLPVEDENSIYKFDELLEYLSGEDGSLGNVDKGKLVFTKGQCAKCHRHGGAGEIMGPDLTSLAKRFTRKEVLQSILFPSHIISDQYAAKSILTVDGKQYTGIVAPGAAGEIVILQSNGKKKPISEDDVDETVISKKSAMPDNLLNELSLEEIADLFAFLGVAPPPDLAKKPSGTRIK